MLGLTVSLLKILADFIAHQNIKDKEEMIFSQMSIVKWEPFTKQTEQVLLEAKRPDSVRIVETTNINWNKP
jgi:hypothetical protein